MENTTTKNEDEPVNYYELLGVNIDATTSELRRAYLKLIKLHHPDKLQHPDNLVSILEPSRFAQQLIEAYSVLIDPIRRKNYDLNLLPHNLSHLQPSSKLNKTVSQVVDLSEFSQIDAGDYRENDSWITERFSLGCRCGGQFIIDEEQMETGVDVIGCDGCSLTIKVDYQPS